MMSEYRKMREYELESDTGPEIRFTGEHIGHASSKRRNSTRWSEMDLYRTRSGKYVVHVIGETENEGEESRYDVQIYSSKEDMMRNIRYSVLTARLFEDAGFDTVVID